jgi:hypothetical protein
MQKSQLVIKIFAATVILFSTASACGSPASLAVPATSTQAGSQVPTRPAASTPTASLTATPIPGILLPTRGVVGPFEARGSRTGYFEGQILREFHNQDPVVGTTVAQEIALQLDAMRSMGINTIQISLSAADAQPGPFVPPACTINPDLGPLWPQPSELELANLKDLFDLIYSKGLHVTLNLSNTHMEDQPNSKIWLDSILEVVKDHPALELVLFGGDIHTRDNNLDGVADECGGRAEATLWEGPDSPVVAYLKWAFIYAHSIGIPYRKLSAEAILGSYISVAEAENFHMTDGHFWNPEEVLKGIFDDLSIPDDQRTYAISFYEQHKCAVAHGIPCEDENPQQWALETITRLFDVIGRNNGARVMAVETGYLTPEVTDWNTELALESLVWIYQNYGIEGCNFWLWTNSDNGGDLDPARTPPVKQRGLAFNYNPVKDVLQQLYTRGESEALDLTPDAIPPVFASVNITPTVVKNGDTVEISARLGETHLFVWVEMHALDSDKTSQVVLLDQGDGTYTRQVPLSLWNIQKNGVKNLKVTAMDFWSNTTTTSLEVELNNPDVVLDAAPPNDNFSGSVLDPAKWRSDLAGNATIRQDGRVIISTDSREPFSAGNVLPAWEFPGDFDVQVDFQIGEGWANPVEGHLDGAVFGVSIDGQRYWITRLMSGGGETLFSMNSIDNNSGEMVSPALAGKYRLIRQGPRLYILFDVGAGWQRITSSTVPAGPAQVYFGNGSIDASQAFTTYFDNFQINAGLTTYKP